MKTRAIRLWSVVAVVIALTGSGFGQSENGAISGTIKDNSEAAVAGGLRQSVDHARNSTQICTSNEDGIFVSAQLPPGTYTIAVEKAGFKRVEKSNVILPVASKISVGDITLEVGAVTETMTVEADARPLTLQTQP